MVFKLREKAELSSFVAENILSLMSDENGGLKDQVEGNAAVLFSDIRSFTTISETHDALEVVEMLNEYFEIWQKAVQKRGGVIERFIGDAVVVIFFEQFSNQYHQDAVQCALDVMEKMGQSKRDLLGFKPWGGYGATGDQHADHILRGEEQPGPMGEDIA